MTPVFAEPAEDRRSERCRARIHLFTRCGDGAALRGSTRSILIRRSPAVGRAGGKLAGARAAGWRLGLGASVQRFLGFALLAQAGLAVGLTLAVNTRFPEYAPVVSTVVLASVAIFEMVGPASTRFALERAGEAGVGARNAAAASTR